VARTGRQAVRTVFGKSQSPFPSVEPGGPYIQRDGMSNPKVRQPCLVFAGLGLDKPEYLALCRKTRA
jgi:hypothetical protein